MVFIKNKSLWKIVFWTSRATGFFLGKWVKEDVNPSVGGLYIKGKFLHRIDWGEGPWDGDDQSEGDRWLKGESA